MPEPAYKAYKARWYIITVFSLVSFGQQMIYSTWGPLSISAEKAYNLTQSDLALLPNWYNIGYFFALFPCVWLVQNKGMRQGVLYTAAMCAIGAAVRCLSFSTPDYDKIVIHIGQALNGLASPVMWFGCTELSEIWFPPKERPLATSLCLSAGSIGLAISFIGPAFVNSYQPETNEELREVIRYLLYIEFIFTAIVLVMAVSYFPARPKTPPSYTATVKRLSMWEGIKSLAGASQAWVMILVYAISTSVGGSWDQVMTKFLEPAMSEEEAGWLGTVLIVVSIVSGPALSLTTEIWMRNHSKLVCVLLMTTGSVCLAILTLSSAFFQQFFVRPTIWTTLIITFITITAPQPIWWELSCEAAFPASEATVSSIASLASAIGSWIFFFLYMFPSLGTDWPTWTFLISEIICIPALLLYKSSSKRSLEDDAHDASHETDPLLRR